MNAHKFSRQALVALVQLSLIASATALPAMAQDSTPLVVNLKNDSPERIPGVKPDPKSIEGGIWADADKAERQARTSGERDSDPALDAYISSVEAKVAGPFSGDIRVLVMDRPFFNADVNPNGYAEVWSGLMLRAQTEDQLAFVLGHETGHFRHSHSLKRFYEIKAGNDALMVGSAVVMLALLGASANSGAYGTSGYHDYTSYGGGLIDVGYLGTVAVLMSYSRGTEAQADAYGLQYASQAGYFPGAGAQIWQGLLNEIAASDDPRVRKMGSRINIFGSHPLESDRIDALNAADRAAHGGQLSTRSDADEKAARLAYRQHIRPFLGAWLKDDLRRKDYGETLFLINRLAMDGEDPGVLNFYKGEAYRERGNPDDLQPALAAYQTAALAPDAPKETPRQIGDVYRRLGDNASAVKAYQAYLAAAPDASDAWMVQDEVDTLNKNLSAAAPAPATPSQGE